MMCSRILLTAAGLQNPRMAAAFLRLLGKPAAEARLLFVPTAATSAEALRMLAKCIDELYRVGFGPDQVVVYTLDRGLTYAELATFDVVYFAGGSAEYLLRRVKEAAFDPTLSAFVNAGGFFMGVSAGSVLAADLGIVNCRFTGIHCPDGSPNGPIDLGIHPDIRLTDNQALVVDENGAVVFE